MRQLLYSDSHLHHCMSALSYQAAAWLCLFYCFPWSLISFPRRLAQAALRPRSSASLPETTACAQCMATSQPPPPRDRQGFDTGHKGGAGDQRAAGVLCDAGSRPGARVLWTRPRARGRRAGRGRHAAALRFAAARQRRPAGAPGDLPSCFYSGFLGPRCGSLSRASYVLLLLLLSDSLLRVNDVQQARRETFQAVFILGFWGRVADHCLGRVTSSCCCCSPGRCCASTTSSRRAGRPSKLFSFWVSGAALRITV